MSSVEQRLLARTTEDPETGCWNCNYSLSNGRYPQINIGRGNKLSTHRSAYQLWIGPIPEGLCVCHTCDNPRCINPEHLWTGTTQENTADRDRKGRNVVSRGDKHWSRTHPEKVARGDRNGSRTHPEKLSRGDRHSKIMKEVAARGDAHSKIMKELFARRSQEYLKWVYHL